MASLRRHRDVGVWDGAKEMSSYMAVLDSFERKLDSALKGTKLKLGFTDIHVARNILRTDMYAYRPNPTIDGRRGFQSFVGVIGSILSIAIIFWYGSYQARLFVEHSQPKVTQEVALMDPDFALEVPFYVIPSVDFEFFNDPSVFEVHALVSTKSGRDKVKQVISLETCETGQASMPIALCPDRPARSKGDYLSPEYIYTEVEVWTCSALGREDCKDDAYVEDVLSRLRLNVMIPVHERTFTHYHTEFFEYVPGLCEKSDMFLTFRRVIDYRGVYFGFESTKVDDLIFLSRTNRHGMVKQPDDPVINVYMRTSPLYTTEVRNYHTLGDFFAVIGGFTTMILGGFAMFLNRYNYWRFHYYRDWHISGDWVQGRQVLQFKGVNSDVEMGQQRQHEAIEHIPPSFPPPSPPRVTSTVPVSSVVRNEGTQSGDKVLLLSEPSQPAQRLPSPVPGSSIIADSHPATIELNMEEMTQPQSGYPPEINVTAPSLSPAPISVNVSRPSSASPSVAKQSPSQKQHGPAPTKKSPVKGKQRARSPSSEPIIIPISTESGRNITFTLWPKTVDSVSDVRYKAAEFCSKHGLEQANIKSLVSAVMQQIDPQWHRRRVIVPFSLKDKHLSFEISALVDLKQAAKKFIKENHLHNRDQASVIGAAEEALFNQPLWRK